MGGVSLEWPKAFCHQSGLSDRSLATPIQVSNVSKPLHEVDVFFMGFIRPQGIPLSQIYAVALKNAPMKPASVHTPFAPRTTRGFALLALALVFLLSAFQLTHLPAVSANHDLIDLWRGLAVGSLFLFFCFPAAGRSHSEH
jgi:hypothetical protein